MTECKGAGIEEITLTVHEIGCSLAVKESGLGLNCFRTYFPSFRTAALAIAEAFALREPSRAEILDRIAAAARASVIPAKPPG